MNKKIFMSGFSIMSALVLMGGAAFAAFTDSASATGNTFSTVTPNLLISVPNISSPAASVPGFTVGGLVPGSTTAAQTFVLQNSNTEASANMTLTGQFVPLSGALDPNLISFTITCVGDQPVTGTYQQWVNAAQSLGSLAPNSSKSCDMTATLSGSATNTAAGQNVVFDAVFVGSIGS